MQLWGYADSNDKVGIKPAFREVKSSFTGIAVAKPSRSKKPTGVLLFS